MLQDTARKRIIRVTNFEQMLIHKSTNTATAKLITCGVERCWDKRGS